MQLWFGLILRVIDYFKVSFCFYVSGFRWFTMHIFRQWLVVPGTAEMQTFRVSGNRAQNLGNRLDQQTKIFPTIKDFVDTFCEDPSKARYISKVSTYCNPLNIITLSRYSLRQMESPLLNAFYQFGNIWCSSLKMIESSSLSVWPPNKKSSLKLVSSRTFSPVHGFFFDSNSRRINPRSLVNRSTYSIDSNLKTKIVLWIQILLFRIRKNGW